MRHLARLILGALTIPLVIGSLSACQPRAPVGVPDVAGATKPVAETRAAATSVPTLPPSTSPATIATASPSALPMAAPSSTATPTVRVTPEARADHRREASQVSATLSSLELVDDHPLYTMRYYGAYRDGASLSEGPDWAGSLVTSSSWACSLFAALGDADRRVYGRNFDWRYSPALLLFTYPPDGYASVSMVDVAYLVAPSDVTTLADLPLEEREALLEAPFWPFDGMNEHGLVVGMAAVPESEMPHDSSKDTIDSLRAIREMLDYARNVEEAIAILGRYNIAWDGGPALHYLIADASGGSTLVEFYAGEMVLIPSPGGSPWHLATNHLLSAADEDGPSECWRYEEVLRRLTRAGGRLSVASALDLLADVAQESTQWSVVYDMSTLSVHVAMGRSLDEVHSFPLQRGGE